MTLAAPRRRPDVRQPAPAPQLPALLRRPARLRLRDVDAERRALLADPLPDDSPIAVGVLSLARFGPFTLFGLFAGVVADRFDNRRTVIVTQSVQMVFSALLAAVTLLGNVQTWQVYAIAMLTGLAVVFDLPARQNLTMQLVGRDELPNAIALNSSLFNTARIFGPALAGVVIAAAGAGWCFAINSASFLAVLAGLVADAPERALPARGPRAARRSSSGVRRGARLRPPDRPMLVLTLMAIVVMSISFNVNVLLPVLAKETLGAGPRTFGIVTSCFGAGALVGALVAAALAQAALARSSSARSPSSASPSSLIAPLHSVVLGRRAPLRLRRLLHDLHRGLELGRAARHARPPARPRARRLLLRLDGAAAAREPADRLALRRRRHRAGVRLRRRLRARRSRRGRRRGPARAGPTVLAPTRKAVRPAADLTGTQRPGSDPGSCSYA